MTDSLMFSSLATRDFPWVTLYALISHVQHFSSFTKESIYMGLNRLWLSFHANMLKMLKVEWNNYTERGVGRISQPLSLRQGKKNGMSLLQYTNAWSYWMSVDDLFYGDVDDRFAKCHHVRVLIHVKLLFWSWNVTCSLEEYSANTAHISLKCTTIVSDSILVKIMK